MLRSRYTIATYANAISCARTFVRGTVNDIPKQTPTYPGSMLLELVNPQTRHLSLIRFGRLQPCFTRRSLVSPILLMELVLSVQQILALSIPVCP